MESVIDTIDSTVKFGYYALIDGQASEELGAWASKEAWRQEGEDVP